MNIFYKGKKKTMPFTLYVFFRSQDVDEYGIELEKIHLSTEVSQT